MSRNCNENLFPFSRQLGKRKNRKAQFTYGWQRAEILGALINGVFLLALCFSVILQAVERFMEPVEIRHPVLMLGVGAVGLAVNVFGLFLFHDHAHGHGHGDSLGHSHKNSRCRDEEPARGAAETIEEIVVIPEPPALAADSAAAADENDDSPSAALSNSLAAPSDQDEKAAMEPSVANGAEDLCLEDRPRGAGGGGHMNMRGVFLHVLGDALGSVGVITAGLVIWLTDLPWKFYVDPIVTLIFAGITLSTTVPLGEPAL
ncbi:MAG: cation efflux protein [Olpidium bornovanus]|uniref:Cation efflux protein n=1 Tax=Olpidium bornovanus TaxID=278681 RepID=A0A8H8DKY6_9FUNG|nr:MAG: cation efflux protein [Olpidium bornovanus]